MWGVAMVFLGVLVGMVLVAACAVARCDDCQRGGRP